MQGEVSHRHNQAYLNEMMGESEAAKYALEQEIAELQAALDKSYESVRRMLHKPKHVGKLPCKLQRRTLLDVSRPQLCQIDVALDIWQQMPEKVIFGREAMFRSAAVGYAMACEV